MIDAPRSRDGNPRVVETRLVATPAAAGVARRFIAATLNDWDAAPMVDDAVLCASELVTNAVLHAGGSFVVRLSRPDEHVLLEVIDEVPIEQGAVGPRSGADDDHMTGRGLAVLASIADAWGVDRHVVAGAREGKVVWARLPAASASAAEDTHGDPQRDLGTASAPHSSRAIVAGLATLIGVPAGLVLDSESHLDDVLRELMLAWWASPGETATARLASRLGAFATRMSGPRAAAATRARQQLAAGAGHVSLIIDVDADVVAAVDDATEALDDVDALARFGLLLTPPAPPRVVAYRRWYAGELRRQAEGSAPLPCPFA